MSGLKVAAGVVTVAGAALMGRRWWKRRPNPNAPEAAYDVVPGTGGGDAVNGGPWPGCPWAATVDMHLLRGADALSECRRLASAGRIKDAMAQLCQAWWRLGAATALMIDSHHGANRDAQRQAALDAFAKQVQADSEYTKRYLK